METPSPNSEHPASDYADNLLAMAKTDQAMRQRGLDTGAWDDELDKQNTAELKKIIEGIGWPGPSKVGAEAAHAAWLIAQHADTDLEFQEQCLALMKEDETVSKTHLAFLEDRVLVNNGQPQLYGTQFRKEGDVWSPQPIADTEKLDERRAAVGLTTFAEYEKQLNQKEA